MNANLPKEKKLVSISEAADVLEVSIDTVRRWDKKGILHSQRFDGKNRYFSTEDLEKIRFLQPLSISQAAKRLSISQSTLRRLEKKGLIKPDRNEADERLYSHQTLEKFLNSGYYLRKKAKDYTEEVVQDEEIPASIKYNKNKKIIYISGLFFVTSFIFLVIFFTASFLLFPEATANFFGYKQPNTIVLGVTSVGAGLSQEISLVAKLFKPFNKVSLWLVKQIDPEVYERIVPKPAIGQEREIIQPLNAPSSVTLLSGIEEIKSAIPELKVTTSEGIATLSIDFPKVSITSSNISKVTAGSGLTGGGDTGEVNLNIGVGTGITVNANDVAIDTGASLTWTGVQTFNGNVGIGASLNVSSIANFISVIGAGLTDCDNSATSKLLWDSSTGRFSCGTDQKGGVPNMNSFTDATADSVVDADTTDYWDGPIPNITPSSSNSEILVMMTASISGTSSKNTQISARILRNIDANITCQTAGTAVGGIVGAFQGFKTGSVTMNAVFVDAPATEGNVRYTLCSEADSEDIDGSITISRIDFTLYEINDAADLAELYFSNDPEILAGDVVSLDPMVESYVRKSNGAYDRNILGVVSTKPALVLGGTGGKGTPVPVALSGRVPVKVSVEGGPIKAGDVLTPSSIPGVAMKATKAGPIIGIALSDFNPPENLGELGTILMFVKTTYFNGISLAAQDPLNQTEQIASDSVQAEDSLKILAGIIFKALVEFVGTVIFHGDINFEGRPTFNKDTAGFAQILKDADNVEVEFEREYAAIPLVNVSITLDNMVDEASQSALEKQILDTDIRYIVTRRTNKGFTIKLNKLAPIDLKFSWTAVAVQQPKTFVSKLNSIPSPLPIPEATNSAAVEPITIKINDNELGYLRVREESTTSSKEIGQVEPGQTFGILAEKEAWYLIEYQQDFYGWVKVDYVTKNN